jgi:CTP-dependent riboflavin kinase
MECKISPYIHENLDFLKLLLKTKSLKKRQQLLKNINHFQLLALTEISLNILHGRCKISTKEKKRMLPYISFIRQLARARSENGSRKIIMQKGISLPANSFPSIIAPIIKILNNNGQ